MERKAEDQSAPRRKHGEGNSDATRQHDQPGRGFERSDKPDEKSGRAVEPISSEERRELEHAELIGRRHAADEVTRIDRIARDDKAR